MTTSEEAELREKCLPTDHNILWSGDGYFCTNCEKEFIPQTCIAEAYDNGKRDGKSVASFNSELKRLEKEAYRQGQIETRKEVLQEIEKLMSSFMNQYREHSLTGYQREQAINAIYSMVLDAKIDETNHWLSQVTWPNNYTAMIKVLKDRLATLEKLRKA